MLNNETQLCTIELIKKELKSRATINPEKAKIFFKTGEGQYAQHDQFLGITVPVLRSIAKKYPSCSLAIIQELLASTFNEERLLALSILVHQYQKANNAQQEHLFNFYLANMRYVNNWNLVDSSAHLIIGAHLWNKDRSLLLQLAQSEDWWIRRIAIVSTWYFIKKNDVQWTFIIAQSLLNDSNDLIHKATGWMMREAGKKNIDALKQFLDKNCDSMPRTMLRYAIEKFPTSVRQHYLSISY